MHQAKRELLIARIVSGCVRCHIEDEHGRPLIVVARRPTREHRYIAQEVYSDVLRESELEGLFTDDEVLDIMVKEGLWSDDKQQLLANVEKDIETLKVKLYELVFRSQEVKAGRKLLAVAKQKQAELLGARLAYNHMTCAGAANVAKMRYLIGSSLFYVDGRPLHDDETFWRTPSFVTDEALDWYVSHKIEESAYRELARTEPWRSIWAGKRGEGSVFGVPSVDLSDEQRSLQVWSLLHDNVAECPDAPPDEVLEDDDMFDGWLIIQRRKRQKGQSERRADQMIGNDKIRNADEVFIVADSVEDARKIDELNDQHSAMLKKQRLSYVQKQGVVNEDQMPDTRMKLQMERNRMMVQGIKG